MTPFRFSLAPLYPRQHLTVRQAECLVALLETQGTYRDIANKMGISYYSVARHIRMLIAKLECMSKKELIYKASKLPWRHWADQFNKVAS